jgi:flagellin
MGLRINTNVQSLAAQRSLGRTRSKLNDNLRKLSSGQRITRASDDAAGLAISEKLKTHIRGLGQAKRNANDGISLIQTAEGALSEVSNIIIRLRELAIQSASDTLGADERRFIDIEFQQLKDEVNRISRSTEFNGIKLLDGTSGALEIQVGVHNDPTMDRIRYDGTQNDATLEALGLINEKVNSKESSQVSLKVLDNALVKVNGVRANLGATQNRLNSIVNTIGISSENLNAANSRVRDVDVANETANMTKNNILFQAGASVLGQANALPNVALKLLNG